MEENKILYRFSTLRKELRSKKKSTRLFQLTSRGGYFKQLIQDREYNCKVAIAELDGNIIGWSTLNRDKKNNNKYIIGWYVAYEFRDRGIAKGLTNCMFSNLKYKPKLLHAGDNSVICLFLLRNLYSLTERSKTYSTIFNRGGNTYILKEYNLIIK